MNEAEQKALTIVQQAYAVLAGREPSDDVVRHLHRLERNTPQLFGEVVTQLELDNGRWNAASRMPAVEVVRDDKGQIEAIIFSEQPKTQDGEHDLDAFLWVSDRVDVKWFESFAEELIASNARHGRSLMDKPPFPPQFAKRERGNPHNRQKR